MGKNENWIYVSDGDGNEVIEMGGFGTKNLFPALRSLVRA